MNQEPRIAKHIAIWLGCIEFIFGLLFSVSLYFVGMWVQADPKNRDPDFWPTAYAIMIAVIFAPPLISFVAERSKSKLTVYICVAILILYPLSLIVWVRSNG